VPGAWRRGRGDPADQSWRLDREQLAAVTAAVAPGISVIEAGNDPDRRIEGAGQRQDRPPHGM
jgi:hypothetical protein